MIQAQLIWTSISDLHAQAYIALNFVTDASYAFDLAPQIANFSARPLVSRSFTLQLTGNYVSVTVRLDNTPYVFKDRRMIYMTDLDPVSRVRVDCVMVGTGPVTAVMIFNNHENLIAKRQGFYDDQNNFGLESLNSTVLESPYGRFTINATLQTVIAPAANVNGVRVDYVALSVFVGSSRVMGKKTAPSSVGDTTALTLGWATATATSTPAKSEFATLPLILSPGFGVYEQSTDATNNSACFLNYKIL